MTMSSMKLSNLTLSSKIDATRVAKGDICQGTPKRHRIRYYLDRNGKITERQLCIKASDWEYHPKEEIERAATPDLLKQLDSLTPSPGSRIRFTFLNVILVLFTSMIFQNVASALPTSQPTECTLGSFDQSSHLISRETYHSQLADRLVELNEQRISDQAKQGEISTMAWNPGGRFEYVAIYWRRNRVVMTVVQVLSVSVAMDHAIYRGGEDIAASTGFSLRQMMGHEMGVWAQAQWNYFAPISRTDGITLVSRFALPRMVNWDWASGLAQWLSNRFGFGDVVFDYNPGNGPNHDELKRSDDPTLTVISNGIIEKEAMDILYQLYHAPKPYNQSDIAQRDNSAWEDANWTRCKDVGPPYFQLWDIAPDDTSADVGCLGKKCAIEDWCPTEFDAMP